MKLFWGDIHNHCGITYGFGGLENALNAAKEQLDFCSVTGHAMWPDMPDRNPDTDFIIDFHLKGFSKLEKNWDNIKNKVEEYNKDGEFVTFQSFEVHSCQFGDYHIVSPDSELELNYLESPMEVLKSQKCRAIAIPHHIGYTPGYRGINWDSFDSTISPVVEVFSKHGCAMSEVALYPYYHDMGPRDSRNTVYNGLKRGKKFSFIASTDHHAGYPGSYGDGRLAVLAEEKTRESIWKAVNKGRTYAVTGDKIKCEFTVNGEVFGSTIHTNGNREIGFNVEAAYFIDKIIIFKNLRPFKVICGESLTDANTSGRYKLRIEMGWGNSKSSFIWNCSSSVKDGRFVDVESCFRGRSVLSPTAGIAEDNNINRLMTKITEKTETRVEWVCETFKNQSTLHPQTSAIILEVEGDINTTITFNINGKNVEMTIKKLLENGMSVHMKPYSSEAFNIHTAVPQSKYCVSDSIIDGKAETNSDIYHMEVYQYNNQAAYVSPIFVMSK